MPDLRQALDAAADQLAEDRAASMRATLRAKPTATNDAASRARRVGARESRQRFDPRDLLRRVTVGPNDIIDVDADVRFPGNLSANSQRRCVARKKQEHFTISAKKEINPPRSVSGRYESYQHSLIVASRSAGRAQLSCVMRPGHPPRDRRKIERRTLSPWRRTRLKLKRDGDVRGHGEAREHSAHVWIQLFGLRDTDLIRSARLGADERSIWTTRIDRPIDPQYDLRRGRSICTHERAVERQKQKKGASGHHQFRAVQKKYRILRSLWQLCGLHGTARGFIFIASGAPIGGCNPPRPASLAAATKLSA